MSKILKNTTGIDIELEIGVTVPANSSLEINELDYLELAESTDIEGFVTSGDIVVNDGINDLNVSDGVNYIKYPNFAESVRLDSVSLNSTNVKDALEELKNTAGNDYGIFCIWAEENAGLANGQREWSFGNGATGDIGIVLPIDADLFAVSYNADRAGTNTEIAVVRNSSTQVATTTPQSGEDGFNNLGAPVNFNAGDRVGFQTVVAGGASDVRVCAWFRVPLSMLIELSLGELSDVTITNPSSGQILTFNGSIWENKTIVSDDIDDSTSINKFATQAQLDQITINENNITNLGDGLTNHVTNTSNPHLTTFTQVVAEDAGTDITASEAEELTNGSITNLHKHRILVDETETTKVQVLDGGDVNLNNYPQTRNDGTSNDEKVLTTDGSGNIILRRVLPFHSSIKKISDAVGSVGVNQTTTLETYLTLNVNIPETGNYDIDWTFVWSSNDTGQDFISDFFLDNNPISVYSRQVQEPADSGGLGINLSNTTGGVTNTGTNQRYRYSSFEPSYPLTSGNHTLEIKWAGSSTNDEAAIYEGSIRIKRVS